MSRNAQMEKLNTIWQFDQILSISMAERGERTYYDELTRLLDLYREMLKHHTIDGENCLYAVPYIHSFITKQIPKLKKLFRYYSKGKIIEFNDISASLFRTQANRQNAVSFFPITTIEENSFWFRARKPNLETRFCREDLFHVPFRKRGIVGSERFSLLGYPCLYLGKTLKCVDAETGGSGIKAVSCFKTNQKIRVFDFTFFSPDHKTDNTARLIDNILSYPLKIAASIPSNAGKQRNEYIPEYIIPQLLLHCALKNRDGMKADGIMYTSTKAILEYITDEHYSDYTNIVIPSVFIKEKGLCSHLNSLFSLTEPEIVPFRYLNDEKVMIIQEAMKAKEFSHIDVDYDPKE